MSRRAKSLPARLVEPADGVFALSQGLENAAQRCSKGKRRSRSLVSSIPRASQLFTQQTV